MVVVVVMVMAVVWVMVVTMVVMMREVIDVWKVLMDVVGMGIHHSNQSQETQLLQFHSHRWLVYKTLAGWRIRGMGVICW